MAGLGGTFKLARVHAQLPLRPVPSPEQLTAALEPAEFYRSLPDKAEWVVSVHLDDLDEPGTRWAEALRTYVAERLRRDGVGKARYLSAALRQRPGRAPELLSTTAVQRRLLARGFEVLAVQVDNAVHVAATVALPDHEAFRHRDFGRPAQYPELTLGPRLARLLVNLAGVPRGGVLLDPFCGVGTILQEAVLLGMEVRGLDIDGRRVADTVANLRWLGGQGHRGAFDGARWIRRGDARELRRYFPTGSVDGIVTEPILLPTYRARPSEAGAQAAIEAAGQIYGAALAEMAQVLKRRGRVVLVVPVLQTHGRSLTLDVQEATSAAGLRFYQPRELSGIRYPLLEVPRPNQIVVRGVHVLERG